MECGKGIAEAEQARAAADHVVLAKVAVHTVIAAVAFHVIVAVVQGLEDIELDRMAGIGDQVKALGEIAHFEGRHGIL